MWITSSLATALTPTAVALGNFDGLHRGHRQVIEPILNLRDRSKLLYFCPSELATNKEAGKGTKLKLWNQDFKLSSRHFENELGKHNHYQKQKIYSTIVTFNPHPQEFFSGKQKIRFCSSFLLKYSVLLCLSRVMRRDGPFGHTASKFLVSYVLKKCFFCREKYYLSY